MTDSIFIFYVVPAFFTFVGFVFTCCFGADILRWYLDQLAAQRKTAVSPIAPEGRYQEISYAVATTRNRESELVHS